MVKKYLGIIGLCLLAITSLATCSLLNSSKEKTIRLAIFRDPIHLDPALAFDETTREIVGCIFDTLYQYDYSSAEPKIVPLLAADMPTFSSDGLQCTIRIKQGVYFHNSNLFGKDHTGKPTTRMLTAADVALSFKRLASEVLASPAWWTLAHNIVGFQELRKDLQKDSANAMEVFTKHSAGVHELDKFTLQINFKKVDHNFVRYLTQPTTAPVPAEAVINNFNKIGRIMGSPIGTGPFLFNEWSEGHNVVLIRNQKYHADFYKNRALPFADKIFFQIYEDQGDAWNDFQAGNLELSPLPAATEDGGTKLGHFVQNDPMEPLFVLVINMKDPLLRARKQLRQAISAAIDRQALIDNVTNGSGQKLLSLLPRTIPEWSKRKLKFDFDLAKSKELLMAAGYPFGKGVPELKLEMPGSDSLTRRTGDFLKQQLESAGIPVKISYNSYLEFLGKMRRADFQLAYVGWQPDSSDVDSVFSLLFSNNEAPGPNWSNFNSKAFDALYVQLQNAKNTNEKKLQIAAQLDDLIQESTPWVLAYYYPSKTAVQPWVLNYNPARHTYNHLKYLDINNR